ncbi:MAG: creatininase family protein [Hyphomicrobiaceae bacterium]
MSYFPDHTNISIADTAQRCPVAVLPVGTVESNGPHQILGCDFVISEEIARRISAQTGATRLPTLHYGVSELHGGLPGTISLDESLFSSLLEAVLAGAAKNGFKRLLVLNCHRHNHQPIEVLGRRFRRAGLADLAVIDPLEAARDLCGDLFKGDSTAAIGHGGEPLMSLMCHLRPDLVRLDQVGPADLEPLGGLAALSSTRFRYESGKVGLFPAAEEVNPTGAWADISTSSAERGKASFEAICDFACNFVRDFQSMDLEARA